MPNKSRVPHAHMYVLGLYLAELSAMCLCVRGSGACAFSGRGRSENVRAQRFNCSPRLCSSTGDGSQLTPRHQPVKPVQISSSPTSNPVLPNPHDGEEIHFFASPTHPVFAHKMMDRRPQKRKKTLSYL